MTRRESDGVTAKQPVANEPNMPTTIDSEMEFKFAPLHSLGFGYTEDRFDLSCLPFEIADGLSIEDVRTHLPQDAFDLWRNLIGESRSESFGRIKYALVRRFERGDSTGQMVTTYATSCLRLIRPMRQGCVISAHGNIKEDGSFSVLGFELAEREAGVEVVEAHKLSALRNADAEELRRLLPLFTRAIDGDFWKFRMAAQFHDLGYFQSNNWKPRFILWASALESIFTSHDRDHQGSRVAIARIKWFIGENTRIYPDTEWPAAIPSCTLTLAEILDDLYRLRNFVAHGDKVPDEFFKTCPRVGINGGVSKLEVLSEAASFIIRTSLLKILRDGLLDHFADAGPAEAFFGAQGLVKSKL